jgi:hypothetical protein
MMILKMNHMCHLLGLILMKKAWRVLAAVAAGDEEIEEEVEEEGGGDDDDEGEEETYVVDEINPSSYIHMGTPTFRIPLNLDWREKINYKGKTDLVREKRKENLMLVEKEPVIGYRFHTTF